MDLRSKDAIESSKQHDIDMGNILIAEFMGKEIYQKHHESNYHCSWDWLMPVVQKCRLENRLEYFDFVYYALEQCDINITYKAVVEFIKNQNN